MTRYLVIFIIAAIAFSEFTITECNSQSQDDSSRGVVLDLCENFLKYEILFTNKCRLQWNNIEPQFDSFYDYVRGLSGETFVDALLKDIFRKNESYHFFTTQYPYLVADYNKFETALLRIYTNLTVTIKNNTMQELIDVAKLLERAYKNVTANPKKTCVTDKSICPVLAAMLDIDVDKAPKQLINEFLESIRLSVFRFLKQRHTDDFVYEEALTKGLITNMAALGTGRANIKKIRQIAITPFYQYLRMINEYEPEVTVPPVVTRIVQKKTTQIAVSLGVYVGVPLAFIGVGILIAVLVIVLVYRMKPNKGGTNQTKPAEQQQKSETDKV